LSTIRQMSVVQYQQWIYIARTYYNYIVTSKTPAAFSSLAFSFFGVYEHQSWNLGCYCDLSLSLRSSLIYRKNHFGYLMCCWMLTFRPAVLIYFCLMKARILIESDLKLIRYWWMAGVEALKLWQKSVSI